MIKLGRLLLAVIALLVPCTALAHHGGVSLAFGPGSPIETASPLTLPEGGLVLGFRAEQVAWKQFDWAKPDNKTSFTFMNANISYGFSPAVMGTFIVPYYVKRQEQGQNDGLSDMKFQLTYGFHHDPGAGFSRNTGEDVAVTMEGSRRTYMTVSFMMSMPTGEFHKKINGTVDPGMQPGFGAPAYTLGFAAAHRIGSFTMNAELSADFFTERENFQFGKEQRANLAAVYELYGGDAKSFVSKFDGILEFNFLHLGRDKENGEGLTATGGDILYLSPGLRIAMPSLQNASFGLSVKLPIWKDLNEQDQQQGAEGLEKYRVITTLSFFF
ncbi:MAG: hypothetical protein HGA43_00640 [Nitrospirae bacterium]|nr:hypothetical protein [Nitrospirota bacterium]